MIAALVFLGGIAVSIVAIKVFTAKHETEEQPQSYSSHQYTWMRGN